MGEVFSHGENVIGQHVDAIVEYIDGYTRFVRRATNEEIEEYCHE